MISLLLAIIYLAFISLGLPDSMLGAAWPSMFPSLDVPVSYAGIISMIIAAGTIISSLFSDKLTSRLGTGKITAISVGTTALALLGFSFSHSFYALCLLALPYGLGAGSVDAALNNYVALHFASRHMSWLHCMWGIGTILGPTIMGWTLTGGHSWNRGFLYISIIQIVLTAIIVSSLPLWKKKASPVSVSGEASSGLSPLQILKIPGAKDIMLCFFCYCAAEATAMLWSGSYLVLHHGMSEEAAATCSSIFFIGITVGRLLNGFLTYKLTDTQMIRIGQSLLVVGIALMLLPFGMYVSLSGIIIFGLGCAPIYPCIIHSTPERFGEDKSQALIGVQMASAYTGSCLMPPVFGLIANHISASLFPVYLLIFTVIMIVVHESLVKKTKQ